MKLKDIKIILEENYLKYATKAFIIDDPISVPHQFTKKEDIEIAGFLTAIIAWGQRKQIIRSATQLMQRMDFAPYSFITNCTQKDLLPFKTFVYRTFNGDDCIFFLKSLRNIYQNMGGIENIVHTAYQKNNDLKDALIALRNVILQTKHQTRNEKHISSVEANSACKRLNLYFRWMIRKDYMGVDFGLWSDIPLSALCIPLDVHTSRTARELGLLHRTQNDWKAVLELTNMLKKLDPNDPVKYDFALFGLSIDEI